MLDCLKTRIIDEFENKQHTVLKQIDQRFVSLSQYHIPGKMKFSNGVWDVSHNSMKFIRAVMQEIPYVLCGIFNGNPEDDAVICAFLEWNILWKAATLDEFKHSDLPKFQNLITRYCSSLQQI